jgi:hypothetical protein
MFKLIGIVVFFAVLLVGYPALTRWYAGEATPKETVDEIRGKLSDKLVTDQNKRSKDEEGASASSDGADNPPQKNGNSKDSSGAAPPAKEVDNLQKMINEVNK